MTVFTLMLRGIRRGRARFACAVAGCAVAVGTLVFTSSFAFTNRMQAPALAAKGSAPWAAWCSEGLERGRGPSVQKEHAKKIEADLALKAYALTVDYRPGGHVLQGPPMRALLAAAPAANPYAAVTLTSGRWVDSASADPEVVCVVRSMSRFGKAPPALGETLKFVGRLGTMTARIVGYLDGAKLPPDFPYVFANGAAVAALGRERSGRVYFRRETSADEEASAWRTPASPSVVSAFAGDEQKRMDYVTPLLLAAAFLTALTLLVNTLLLSVEANRATFAVLRTIGLTRGGVIRLVTAEAFATALIGWILGASIAAGALALYIWADAAAFPCGVYFDVVHAAYTLLALPVVVFLAVLFALRPALRVRPADAAAARPRTCGRGMAVTFGCGFAAFVAVEVWGASLMCGFVPSATWPDAIVSLLPGGVAPEAVARIGDVPGVRRLAVLQPRQCDIVTPRLDPEPKTRRDGRPPYVPNALFLASDFLPEFEFVEGTRAAAECAVFGGDGVVITEMMRNAYGLHPGDRLAVRCGRGPEAEDVSFPVVGVVKLNWHMVTSRGLVRGLDGASGMTDGPVFCSPKTFRALGVRRGPERVTHLWVDYDPAFLAQEGVFPAGRAVEAEIVKRLGDPVEATVRLHARDEIADGTLAHGSDLIGQAARVPFVFLAILAIGFTAMLVAEADAEKRTFAVLRAVGATRAQIAGRLVRSALRTAAAGIAWGLPVGALVGWLFTFKTNIWPGMPHAFDLPVRIVAEGACGALVFALSIAVPVSLALVAKRMRRH